MHHANVAPRRIGRLGLALLAATLPACHGAGPWYRNTRGNPYVVYKPVATSLRGRPFYVSGYGGSDYTPPRRRLAPMLAPVSVQPMPDPAVNPTRVTVSQGSWDQR